MSPNTSCFRAGILHLTAILTFGLLFITTAWAKELPRYTAQTPFTAVEQIPDKQAVQATFSRSQYQALEQTSNLSLSLPTPDRGNIELELTQFSVTTPDAKLTNAATGETKPLASLVTLFKGNIAGDPLSHAAIGFSEGGMVNGYVSFATGEVLFISTPNESLKSNPKAVISYAAGFGELPEGVEVCPVKPDAGTKKMSGEKSESAIHTSAGDRLITIAAEADDMYLALFPDETAAAAYILQLMGTISEIYDRDLACRFIVNRIRIWPFGPEDFGAADLDGFQNWWLANNDGTGINIVHLFSGHRDLSYGGIAFVGGFCSDPAFSIGGYLNGSYPNPFGETDLGNWDVIVVAHEMGHNMGTYHTHDGYVPTIDDCGNGTPSRGGIMSYCHTFPGYVRNIDLNFHRRIQNVINSAINGGGCLPHDCNGNNISDATDISLGAPDTNHNGILDECEDCNGNNILDPAEISGGAPDINHNGILDECEPDCNNNNLPDEYEVAQGMVPDSNGNNIPDACEPDCNNNGKLDWEDIEEGISTDYDRNVIPDECQDCNNNGKSDWIDMDRQYNIYIADRADYVREYHGLSGAAIGNFGTGVLNNPYDLIFGSDNKLYVASFQTDQIVRINPDNNTSSVFIAAGSGGLDGPSSLVFGPNGNLFVASNVNNRVLQYNGTTGAFIGIFTPLGANAPTGPYGLVFGPNGNLFVTGSDNTVKQYNGTTGAYIGNFVSVGSGGLSSPRGLAFKPNGNLLVCSFGSNKVLEYSTSGSFIQVFNDAVTPTGAWGIRIGPNGNVFVMRSSGTIRLLEYVVKADGTGRYYRPMERDDSQLPTPTGFAFRGQSTMHDCNGNGILDACDISSNFSLDVNHNGRPDECEVGDTDGDGITDFTDNCPFVSNPTQTDTDGDNVGNVCDNCPATANADQADTDGDAIGDVCDNCTDTDGDGFGNPGFAANSCPTDNCPTISNPTQANADLDGFGDACDACPNDANNDIDGDGVCGNVDNCPVISNPGQQDSNHDGTGDACCCIGIRGNVNGDANQSITIADLTRLVGFLFGGNTQPLPCPMEANVNGDAGGSITITDLTFLVQFLFTHGGAPPACP